jgi:CBS domain-containing protein
MALLTRWRWQSVERNMHEVVVVTEPGRMSGVVSALDFVRRLG